MAAVLGRLRSLVSARTVARQVFVLQAAIVVLLVVAAVVALVLQVRNDTEREARNRSLAVAEAFAPRAGNAFTVPEHAAAHSSLSEADFPPLPTLALATEGPRK